MRTARVRSRVWVLAAATVAALLVGTQRSAAAEEVLRDEWSVVHFGGAKAGYEHVVVRKLADPARIETTKESRIRMVRLGEAVETSSQETSVESAEGVLLSIAATDKQSAVESKTTYAFEGGKARVTTETMGQTREATVDVPAGLLGPWKADRMPVEAGFPAGKTFDAKMFLRELGGPMTVHTKVVGPEETELQDGKKATLVRLEQTIEGMPIVGTMWQTPEGVIEKVRVTIAGMLIETWRATKEVALAKDDGGRQSPDVFLKTLILSKVLLPHARTLETALLRLTPKGPDAKVPALASDRQTVERTEADGATVVRVRRTAPPDGAASRPLENPSKELAPYLASSSALQVDDPAIVQVAQEAVGGEKDAWKAAQKIERWVHKNLTKKSMGVGFASALEVCRNREGDCTEHAVLVAAMCRAAGIPARVVMGIEYIAGIWGGHAWDEVWIAGRWYALDATNAHGFVDALHLAVAWTALSEGSFGQELIGLFGFVGSVTVDALEVGWKGRTIAPADPKTITVDGRRYENRLFDVAFTAPEGYDVEAVTPKSIGFHLATASAEPPSRERPRISLHADDLASDGLPKPAGASETKVDGRAAWIVPFEKGGLDAVVIVDDIVFRFHVGSDTPAAKAALEALLATVDLDPAK